VRTCRVSLWPARMRNSPPTTRARCAETSSLAAALIHRLLQHCHIVIRGNGYRMRAQQDLLRPRRPTRSGVAPHESRRAATQCWSI